jgi:putative addiction module component (TIGR02574 family)
VHHYATTGGRPANRPRTRPPAGWKPWKAPGRRRVSCSALLGGAPRDSLALVSKTGEKLLEDALKLALAERAELAVELLASLDGAPDADAEAAWAAEIERRAARARSGTDPGRPWPEARDRIQSGLAKR